MRKTYVPLEASRRHLHRSAEREEGPLVRGGPLCGRLRGGEYGNRRRATRPAPIEIMRVMVVLLVLTRTGAFVLTSSFC
jgi:hypothetical protein